MLKPNWAIGWLIFLGTAAVLVAGSCVKEEEVAQQAATASPTASAAASPPATASPPSAATPSSEGVPADWKSYSDPTLGFSLRYPPDLVVQDSGFVRGQRGLEFRSPQDRSRAFVVAIVENPRGLTLEQWVLEFAACIDGTIKPSQVRGKTALICTSQPEETPENAVAFQHMGYMFLVRFIMPSDEFQLIISSLRL